MFDSIASLGAVSNLRLVFCKFDGKHPSKLSHQIIAKKLLKYMGDYND